MAKTTSKSAGAGKKTASRTRSKKAAGSTAKKKTEAGASARKASSSRRKTGSRQNNAAEAIAGLLETPMVAEVIAAGAAAALSTLTQHALSKRSDGGTAEALKLAAKAAASAMGTRLATEFDAIVRSANESRRESS